MVSEQTSIDWTHAGSRNVPQKSPNFPVMGLSVELKWHTIRPTFLVHLVPHYFHLILSLLSMWRSRRRTKAFSTKKHCHRNSAGDDRPFIVFTLPEAPIRTISADSVCVCVGARPPTHYIDYLEEQMDVEATSWFWLLAPQLLRLREALPSLIILC